MRMWHWRVGLRTVTAVAMAMAVMGASVVGQTGQAQPPPPPPDPQQRPIFTTRVDSVSVDVVVTDRQGNLVTDLTAADFTITESRQPQTIDSFKLVRIDDDIDPDPARHREILSLSDQERELLRDDVRVIVIYLDDYHTRLGNSMAIRERLARFVRDLDPRDLVALMTPLMSIEAITFTRNHSGTAQQILQFQGRKYDYTPKHPAEEVYQYLTAQQIELLRNQIVMEGLEGLAVHLGTVRDGRKSVVYVSEGMLSEIPPGTRTTGLFGGTAMPPQTMQQQMAATRATGAGMPAGQFELREQLRRVFLAASRSNTAFYPLDPRGLAASEYSVADNVGQSADFAALRDSLDVLHVLATNTDGRAIVNSNDPVPALQQMRRDSSAYYLLGYTSTLAPRDGKFHSIRVTVNRRDVEVRARSGYWAYSDEDIKRASRPAFVRPVEVERAFDDIADAPGALIRSWWTSGRRQDGRTDVTIVWEALRTTGPGATVPAQVSVTAGTEDGDLIYRGRAAREDDPTGRVAGRVTFPAPPGTLVVRLVAETAEGDRLDTQERDLVVPDLTTAAPIVTTPVVFRGRTARDMTQLRAAASPLPTTARQFSRTERLLVRFSVYMPGDAPAAPVVRLLNRNGDVMSTIAVTMDPVRGAEAEVVLGSVPPGDYLLEAAASDATDAPRVLVAFRVTS